MLKIANYDLERIQDVNGFCVDGYIFGDCIEDMYGFCKQAIDTDCVRYTVRFTDGNCRKVKSIEKNLYQLKNIYELEDLCKFHGFKGVEL